MADKLTFAIPVEWSKTNTYENNMIVFVGKKAYTAIKSVPTGIEITDTSYWAETGVPQATDLSSMKSDIETLKTNVSSIATENSERDTKINNNANSITSIRSDLDSAQNLIDSANSRLDNIMISLYKPYSE